jgi:hypothetical protein
MKYKEENYISSSPIKNNYRWYIFAIYFIAVPLILTFVFLFSNELKTVLLLYPNNPTFISILGSNYLHTTFSHFISNLVFYLVIMSFIFTFDLITNKKMLLINIILLLIVLPIFASLVNVSVFSFLGSNLPSKGFSAVVAGVFGYLAFSTLHFIREYYEVKFEKSILHLMWLIFYINLLIISLVYGYYFAVIVLLVLVVVFIIYTKNDIKIIFSLLRRLKRSARVVIFVSFYFCLFVGVIGLFPGNLKNNGTYVNILAHYVGYIFGFMVPAVVSMFYINRKK